jgi:23S rRNA pseudouridine2605 synthase
MENEEFGKNQQEQPKTTSDESSKTNGSSLNQDQSQGSSFRSDGRPQRPRIHVQRAYTPRQGDDDGGFRPSGFGEALQHNNSGYGQRPYRPRYNNEQGQGDGGYQPRQNNYNSRPYNGGGYRPRYNNEQGQQDGGYQPRQNNYRQNFNKDGEQSEGGYRPRQNNYRPRYNNDGDQQEGDTQQRQGGYQPRQGGYQPRQDGYQPRQGGYQPRQGGYQQRQGGYQQRQGGYQQRQGGYQPRQGGYRPRYNNDGEDGGYQQRPNYRPRYNNDGGGYNRGGYNQGGYRQHTADYDPNAKYSLKKRIEYKEEHTDPNEPIRLNKYLANAGVCSRREADEFIQNGVVTVNGEVVKELGTKVKRSDAVVFNGQPVSIEKKVYVLLNKPKDCVTTSDDPEQRKTVMDLVKDACPERIYPVGRLDRNTTGVLLLTNDGDLASKLTHPKFLKKKVYQVVLDKPVTEFDMQKIAEGIELEDGEVHADAIEYPDEMDKSKVGIEIHSGKNRIVRRIFESLGYRVIRLDRVQFAGLTKKNVRRGDWRFLTEKEVEMLRMGAFE